MARFWLLVPVAIFILYLQYPTPGMDKEQTQPPIQWKERQQSMKLTAQFHLVLMIEYMAHYIYIP
jgi:hypothetical protein